MEALCSSLVVRMKTGMIDSSCRSHITGSKGLLSHNTSNHTERSWHPQVHLPLNPSLNYAYEMTDFPGNFSKHPTVVTLICHEPNELAYVCVWLCMWFSVCGWMSELCTCKSHRADASSVSGDGEHPWLSHMWLIKQMHTLNSGWNINICHSSSWKVPKQGTRSMGGPPKSAPCHLFCVSLTFYLSLTWMSSHLISPLCALSPPLALLF